MCKKTDNITKLTSKKLYPDFLIIFHVTMLPHIMCHHSNPLFPLISSAQLFGSPVAGAGPGGTPLLIPQQTAVPLALPPGARTPSHTPTPPPQTSQIMSPPGAQAQLGRKPSLPGESSTIHHMAHNAHQANMAASGQGKIVRLWDLGVITVKHFWTSIFARFMGRAINKLKSWTK